MRRFNFKKKGGGGGVRSKDNYGLSKLCVYFLSEVEEKRSISSIDAQFSKIT